MSRCILVSSLNSYGKCVTPSLNAASQNGGVGWFNSSPPKHCKGASQESMRGEHLGLGLEDGTMCSGWFKMIGWDRARLHWLHLRQVEFQDDDKGCEQAV